MLNQVSLCHGNKVKHHQRDAKPPFGDMLKSCKTDFFDAQAHE